MNNLQLFRMYQRFERKQAIASYKYRTGGGDNNVWEDWVKWCILSLNAAEELVKRLAPPANDNLQHFHNAVAYWTQPTLYECDR